jgi:hypothetical protein
MVIANQSGWELSNRCGFTAMWVAEKNGVDVMVQPDKRDAEEFLPISHFGDGILTWPLPFLFRTPPGYNLLVRGPANYPKDGVCALEGIVETDWASATFTMNWKLTRKLMPVRFEVDEPICMIVPQRRAELEEFAPELRPIESDEDLQRKYEFFLRSRNAAKQIEQIGKVAAGEHVEWQGDYPRGRHANGEEVYGITRLAVIFAHLFSQVVQNGNRTAGRWFSYTKGSDRSVRPIAAPSADARSSDNIGRVPIRCSTASGVRRRNPAAIRRVDAIAALATTR